MTFYKNFFNQKILMKHFKNIFNVSKIILEHYFVVWLYGLLTQNI